MHGRRFQTALRFFTLSLVGLGGGCQHGGGHKAEARAKPKPIAVATVLVATRVLPSTLLLAGTLKANQEAEVAANATGQVRRTFVERGGYVAAGERLAQLDVRLATLGAAEAEANAEATRVQRQAAEEECARVERLLSRGAISQAEHDRQRASCKAALSSTAAAETRVALARQTLSDGSVRAPFAGLVVERYVSVGEYVTPAAKVAHLVDIDPLRLELTLPEREMAAVHEGQEVSFEVAAFPDRVFTGVVHYIGPAVRATTRDLVFEALVQNRDKRLRPGLFATARLDVGQRTLPVVPKTALRQEGETTRLFAVVERHLEERIVQLGPGVEGVVGILDGVAAGETVVAPLSDGLSDGAEVE